MDPTCEYVRNAYRLDVRKGSRVLALGKPGTVTGATHHVYVRLDGEKHAEPYHPSDVVVAAAGEGQ